MIYLANIISRIVTQYVYFRFHLLKRIHSFVQKIIQFNHLTMQLCNMIIHTISCNSKEHNSLNILTKVFECIIPFINFDVLQSLFKTYFFKCSQNGSVKYIVKTLR